VRFDSRPLEGPYYLTGASVTKNYKCYSIRETARQENYLRLRLLPRLRRQRGHKKLQACQGLLLEVLHAHGPVSVGLREQHGGPAAAVGHAEIPAGALHRRSATQTLRFLAEGAVRRAAGE